MTRGLLLLLSIVPGIAPFGSLAAAVGKASEEPSLTLHFDKAHQLDDAGNAIIRPLALRFLESSNFNSSRDRETLRTTTRTVHDAYRKAVAGRYLVVSFESPRRVKTIGGEVEVLEAVIGLNRPDYADSLFTIDAEGRIVSHEKYSGAIGIELLEAVMKRPPGF